MSANPVSLKPKSPVTPLPPRKINATTVILTTALTMIALAGASLCFYYGIASTNSYDIIRLGFSGGICGVGALIGIGSLFKIVLKPEGNKDSRLPEFVALAILGAAVAFIH